jgi:tumor protein p53-inducible protein 3
MITQPGGPEVLVWSDAPDPTPAPGEIVIDVKASAVNRADLLQRKGLYPPPPGAPDILGLEAAGTVAALGEGVGGWTIGQPVMTLLAGGGYAEKVAVNAGQVMAIPAGMSFTNAAALPEAFLTAYMNLFDLGKLAAGETVLIHAGGSGVGTAAIQIAREIGASVIVTAGDPEKLQKCTDLGANHVVNYKAESFAERVREITSGAGVNLILDFVGADYFEPNLASLALGGRLVLIGQLSGGKTNIDLSYVMRRRLTITGTTLRARSTADKADLTARLTEFAAARFADGRLKPIVDSVYPMPDAAEAHRYMETNRNFGKIVLSLE